MSTTAPSTVPAAYGTYIDSIRVFASKSNRNKFWQKIIGYVQKRLVWSQTFIYLSGSSLPFIGISREEVSALGWGNEL